MKVNEQATSKENTVGHDTIVSYELKSFKVSPVKLSKSFGLYTGVNKIKYKRLVAAFYGSVGQF